MQPPPLAAQFEDRRGGKPENDESRKRFEVLAREVFTKFKACLTMKAVNDFRTEVSAARGIRAPANEA
jgi:hypothetical protein